MFLICTKKDGRRPARGRGKEDSTKKKVVFDLHEEGGLFNGPREDQGSGALLEFGLTPEQVQQVKSLVMDYYSLYHRYSKELSDSGG